MKKRILALATCFNRKSKTLRALDSLTEGNPGLDISYVIADDNSSDGTAEALRKTENVIVVSGDGNSFYTGGMRLAMMKALELMRLPGERDRETTGLAEEIKKNPYDYILLFNDDVDFFPGAIERLAEKAEEKSKERGTDLIVYVGPACENDGETLSYGGIERKSNFRPKFRIVKADTEKGRKVNTFNANCVLVPAELFLKTGIMDKVYNHSLGDFDYGYMLVRNGAEIYVDSAYAGVCPDNTKKGTWDDPSLTRIERFKKKESIKGVPFREFFHYLFKNYNFLTAIIYSLTPYAKILLGK
ncbi:MAG: glycosyltransferase family 2 protein [Lachnospiraceae bacterium]|nr:glycosyltransferase family 2 protein [Lachnospiraceae bacterium]